MFVLRRLASRAAAFEILTRFRRAHSTYQYSRSPAQFLQATGPLKAYLSGHFGSKIGHRRCAVFPRRQ